MEKKLRIQLFDDEGRMIDDRMVVQDPELSKGPTNTHKGPMRIEFSFDSESDIEKAKTYLDQLVGNLPLGPKKARKKNITYVDDPEHREELMKEALSHETQDEMIDFLREKGFVFMMYDFLETFDFPGLTIKERHQEKYQWMIYQKKKAKNPKADKYDPMLIFGIQMYEERNEKIVVYLHGEFKEYVKIAIPDKPKEVFKTTTMMKFPPFMEHHERDKFRFELRQYQDNPERKVSKFWKRWRKWVENVPEIPQDKKSDKKSDEQGIK